MSWSDFVFCSILLRIFFSNFLFLVFGSRKSVNKDFSFLTYWHVNMSSLSRGTWRWARLKKLSTRKVFFKSLNFHLEKFLKVRFVLLILNKLLQFYNPRLLPEFYQWLIPLFVEGNVMYANYMSHVSFF